MGVCHLIKARVMGARTLIATDRFPFERFVTQQYPLARAVEAIAQAEEGDSLKVVLTP